MTHIFVCPDASYDASTGQCSAGVWVDASTLTVVPPLSGSDAQVIGFGIAVAWVSGYLWRLIGKALDG